MVKKVRRPGQAKVRTSKMGTRISRPVTEITQKQVIEEPEKAVVGPDEVDIDDIILE